MELKGQDRMTRFLHIQRLPQRTRYENGELKQMCTAYLNSAEKHTGRPLRSIINVTFNTKEPNRLVRRQNATATEKRLTRAYLADIASFKDIMSNTNTYNEVQNRMDELE